MGKLVEEIDEAMIAHGQTFCFLLTCTLYAHAVIRNLTREGGYLMQ